MKYMACAFFLFASILPPAVLSEQNSRPVAAVLDFEAAGMSASEAREYSDYFSRLLEQTGEFKVIAREQRERLIREHELVEQERPGEANLKLLGEAIGADLVVTGRILQRDGSYTLEVMLIETDSGRVLSIAPGESANTRALFDDSRTLVHTLIQEFRQQQRGYPQKASRSHKAMGLGYGLFSGIGLINGLHVPAGCYIEMIYPKWTFYALPYCGFFSQVLYVELSCGYPIALFAKMNLIPFAGISLYSEGIVDDQPEGAWQSVTGGLNTELMLREKGRWKLNLRINGSLPFYGRDDSNDPFTGALLYILIGAGYIL
jgi:TolB-like protein